MEPLKASRDGNIDDGAASTGDHTRSGGARETSHGEHLQINQFFCLIEIKSYERQVTTKASIVNEQFQVRVFRYAFFHCSRIVRLTQIGYQHLDIDRLIFLQSLCKGVQLLATTSDNDQS